MLPAGTITWVPPDSTGTSVMVYSFSVMAVMDPPSSVRMFSTGSGWMLVDPSGTVVTCMNTVGR